MATPPKEISPADLLDLLLQINRDRASTQVISYRAGNFAARSTLGDVIVLARHSQVFGILDLRGNIKSVRLVGSKHEAFKILKNARVGTESKPHAITTKRASGVKWPVRYDRAKLGRMGGFKRMSHPPKQTVVEALPGNSTPIVRHVIARAAAA